MKYLHKTAAALVIFLIGISGVVAQDDTCSTIVTTALETVGSACASLNRNEACYGHQAVDAVFREDSSDWVFRTPADRVSVGDLQRITTGSLNLADDTWGLAVLSLQVNIPDTLPGQTLTFLLMGDTQLENEIPPFTPVAATVKSDANLRSLPTTNATIVGGLDAGEAVMLTGTNEAKDWYQISLDDGHSAWIWSELIDAMNISALPVTEAGSYSRPMQAVYFTTGIGEADCKEAPNALVVQSPDVIEVAFTINGLDITLGSTVIFTTMELSNSNAHVLVALLIEGKMTAQTNSFQIYLTEPGDYLALTLNEYGWVDATSEQLDFAEKDNMVERIQAMMQKACQNSHTTGLLTHNPEHCQIELHYVASEQSTSPTLTDVESDGTCTIAASSAVNLRSGPGTNYPYSGGLNTYTTSNPIGQAQGTDGFTWWQLSENQWVRSDVVVMTNDCEDLPLITELPPVPTPVPISTSNPSVNSGGNLRILHSGSDHECPSPIPVNSHVLLSIGYGFVTREEAEMARASDTSQILLNGVPVPTRPSEIQSAPDGQYAYNPEYHWTPSSPGTYTITLITWQYGTITCVTNVE